MLRLSNYVYLIVLSILGLVDNSAYAKDVKEVPHLEEDFLNYLADISIDDGELIGPLDMLEMEDANISFEENDNQMKLQKEISNNHSLTPGKSLNSEKQLSSEQKEEQNEI